MNEREQLPPLRRGWTRKVRIGGQKLYLTVNEYPDGRPGEIFLRAAKTGQLVQAMLDGWAVSVSVNLQMGVPLDTLLHSFENTNFTPSGPVAGDPDIKLASSLFDYVVRRLALTYLPAPDAAGDVATPPAAEKVAGKRSTTGTGVCV